MTKRGKYVAVVGLVFPTRVTKKQLEKLTAYYRKNGSKKVKMGVEMTRSGELPWYEFLFTARQMKKIEKAKSVLGRIAKNDEKVENQVRAKA